MHVWVHSIGKLSTSVSPRMGPALLKVQLSLLEAMQLVRWMQRKLILSTMELQWHEDGNNLYPHIHIISFCIIFLMMMVSVLVPVLSCI